MQLKRLALVGANVDRKIKQYKPHIITIRVEEKDELEWSRVEQMLIYIQGNKREAFENLLGGFHDREKEKDARGCIHDVHSNNTTSMYIYICVCVFSIYRNASMLVVIHNLLYAQLFMGPWLYRWSLWKKGSNQIPPTHKRFDVIIHARCHQVLFTHVIISWKLAWLENTFSHCILCIGW